jgi:hypothetical protein
MPDSVQTIVWLVFVTLPGLVVMAWPLLAAVAAGVWLFKKDPAE